MKPLPSMMLLTLSLGLGVFAHHLTEKGSRASRAKPSDAAPRSPIPPAAPAPDPVKDLSASLTKDGVRTPRDWITLGDKLASFPAGQFPLLCAELAQRAEGKLQADSSEIKTLLEYWAAADPGGLLRAAEQSQHGLTLFLCAPYCMIYDFPATVAAIQRQSAEEKDKEKTAKLWYGAFRFLFDRDPAGALRQAETLGLLQPGSVRISFQLKDELLLQPLKGALEEWSLRDPSAAANFALKYPDLHEVAFWGWLKSQPEAAFAWIQAHPQIDKHGEWMQNGLSAWLEKDAPAALAWRDGHPDMTIDGPWTQKCLAAWLSKHPDQAETFRGLFKDKEFFYRAVAVGLSEQSAQAAAKWISTLEESAGDQAFRAVFDELRQSEPLAAVSFCGQLPQYAGEVFLEQGFSSLSDRNPAAAVEALMSGQFSNEVKNRHLPVVIRDWLARDLRAARAFIAAQPPSELTGVLMLQASHLLRDGDADSARDFALSLPDPALRVGACRKVLQEQFFKDDSMKGKAAEWVAAISDPAVKSAMEQLLKP